MAYWSLVPDVPHVPLVGEQQVGTNGPRPLQSLRVYSHGKNEERAQKKADKQLKKAVAFATISAADLTDVALSWMTTAADQQLEPELIKFRDLGLTWALRRASHEHHHYEHLR